MNQSESKENTGTVHFGFISNWLSKLQESGTNPRSTVILLSTLSSKQLLISVAATEKKELEYLFSACFKPLSHSSTYSLLLDKPTLFSLGNLPLTACARILNQI